ncbi:MAG: FixH family protein [Flavobacteriales bacterium]|nr:FixH family protein [Flavobacteriales bacterium]
MNWGKALALALIAFAGMMTWFVIKASQNPEPLVTEDYYGAELKYQGRIDETARAKALSAPVAIALTRGSVQLDLPAEMQGRKVTGTLTLLRPNDPRADRTIALPATDAGGYALHDVQLLPGRYNAMLEWQADGIAYYTEEKAYVQ